MGASGRTPDDWSERGARIERLYRASWDAMVAAARHALGDDARANAQDLAAEVFIDAAEGRFRALPARDDEAAKFIAAVIRHRARHLNRRAARTVALSDELAGPARDDPWRAAERILVARDVAEAMRRLTPRERQVAVLHWLGQWSGPQIAERLGISTCTVKELLRRAGHRLRARLACHDGQADAARDHGAREHEERP